MKKNTYSFIITFLKPSSKGTLPPNAGIVGPPRPHHYSWSYLQPMVADSLLKTPSQSFLKDKIYLK